MENYTNTMQSIMESSASANLSSMAATVRSYSQRYFKQLSVIGRGLTERLKVAFVGLGDLEEWVSLEGFVYCALIFVFIVCMFLISRNIYRKIRYSIPATVNCWFCNCNTKVLSSLRETWTCPKCHQYNGFTADGNYNKRIPAQFIEALNRPIRGAPAKDYQPKSPGSNLNGLCSQCNLNQVLKVFQLASFVPVNERNYDAEIEAEQKRLEQLYDICGQCKGVVEETLKREPEKQQIPIRRKIKINKVVPSPPQETNTDSTLEDLERSYQDFKNGRSCSSNNDSGDSFLSLDNLQIRSNNRNFEEFHLPPMSSPSPRSSSQSRLHSPHGQPNGVYSNNQAPYGSTLRLNKEMPPLWRDYPMVQNGLSPAFSVIDSMSCPVGRPAYISYNASVVSPGPSQFNYQSSNAGTVFGGRKPLVSPPKFNVGASHFGPYVRYGAYYDVSSAPAPVMLNAPQFFTNPISRSSSQSSGFVSQHGGVTTPTQQTPPNSGGLYM